MLTLSHTQTLPDTLSSLFRHFLLAAAALPGLHSGHSMALGAGGGLARWQSLHSSTSMSHLPHFFWAWYLSQGFSHTTQLDTTSHLTAPWEKRLSNT